MRNLIHEASFAVFAIALLFALAALVARFVAGGRWSMVGACAVAAVAAYTVGWLTEPGGNTVTDPAVLVALIAAVIVVTFGGHLLFQTWATRPARKTEEV